jgi:hypothetical protein
MRIGAQVSRMLESHFTWWQKFRSPFHLMWFYWLKRTYSKNALSVDRSDWVKLKALVIRIRFGFRINFSIAQLLDHLIREKWVTERDVWRLLHSPGCRISADGLEPAPLPPIVGSIGLSVFILLGMLAVLLLQPLMASLWSECLSPICQVVGCAMLASWCVVIGYVVVVCTWGRSDAATVLSRLLDLDFTAGKVERFVVKRPLALKLLW